MSESEVSSRKESPTITALGREARLVGFAAAFAIFVASAYFIFFIAMKSRLGGPESWGSFGDYFGGLVNPIIGVVTVILVVRTLDTTRKEAAESRKQFERQLIHYQQERTLLDMRYRLESVYAEWKHEMAEESGPVFTGKTKHGVAISGGTRRSVLGTEGLAEKLKTLNELDDENRRVSLQSWRDSYGRAALLLEELAIYCHNYDDLTGSGVLTSFYKRRVSFAANALQQVGLLSARYADLLEPAAVSGEHGAWYRGFSRDPATRFTS